MQTQASKAPSTRFDHLHFIGISLMTFLFTRISIQSLLKLGHIRDPPVERVQFYYLGYQSMTGYFTCGFIIISEFRALHFTNRNYPEQMDVSPEEVIRILKFKI